jgi:ABC-type lipoprotein release transport system permease subunit
VAIDGKVVAMACAVIFLAGILGGIYPALQASKIRSSELFKK